MSIMKIFGFDLYILLYCTIGIIGGIGFGIVISNMYLFSIGIGFLVAFICFILSVYIWNKKLRKKYMKYM